MIKGRGIKLSSTGYRRRRMRTHDLSLITTFSLFALLSCPAGSHAAEPSYDVVMADGNAESKVRQGVTLDVIGESQTVAPLKGGVLEEYKEEAKRRSGVDVDWTTLDGYFRRLGKSGTSINIASSVSPQQVRRVVVGFDDRPATKAEIEQMTQLVRQAMEEGAVNLSTAFTGGGYKYKDEMVAMARVVASYGGYYGTHIGGEGAQIDEELDKALALADETG